MLIYVKNDKNAAKLKSCDFLQLISSFLNRATTLPKLQMIVPSDSVYNIHVYFFLSFSFSLSISFVSSLLLFYYFNLYSLSSFFITLDRPRKYFWNFSLLRQSSFSFSDPARSFKFILGSGKLRQRCVSCPWVKLRIYLWNYVCEKILKLKKYSNALIDFTNERFSFSNSRIDVFDIVRARKFRGNWRRVYWIRSRFLKPRAGSRPFSPCCLSLSSYLLYSSILSPHAKLEDSPLRTAPSAKKRQRGRLHATCRWSWLLAGEST